MRLAGADLFRAGAAVAAKDDRAPGIVEQQIAERINRIGRQRWGKCCRVAAFTAAVERGTALLLTDGPGTGINDQPAALGNIGVAPRRVGRIAVLTQRRVELVPARLLVGEIDLPADLGQRPVITAAFDLVADLERPAIGAFLVIDKDLKACRLALNAALGVAKLGDENRGNSIGAKTLVAGIVTFHR